MKPTRQLRSQVRRLVKKYARQVNVAEPRVACTLGEARPGFAGMAEWKRIFTVLVLGAYYEDMHTVFINIEMHEREADLEPTVVHELVHARFPEMRHGESFDNTVNEVLLGRRFPPPAWESGIGGQGRAV